MSRLINLSSYLPQFLLEYKELSCLLDTQTLEVQRLSNAIGNTLADTFIACCDAVALKRIEQMLGIHSIRGDDIEVRRSRVIAAWNNSVPFTEETLLRMLVDLQGNSCVLVQIINTEYLVRIKTELENGGQHEGLTRIIKTVIPCNMLVESINVLDCITSGAYAPVAAMTATEVIGIKTE